MHFLKPIHILLVTLLLSFSSPTWAMNLSTAMSQLSSVKQQGLVGEQPDGYLGVIKNQNNAQNVTQLINQARKQQYNKLAKTHNISLSEIEALAGKKAIEKTPSGLYIKINGKWMKKP
ncbi:YdbL family protein [Thiomicrorhabdus sp. Milos-T2]|uniref:YdbL family protein n=1 Tax=Thiomicrorhabdus sp. Milos-T2 TaxID=90814 RepID=UPI0004944A55|nr:YdbL family protein [Thiomicrorhabdus sp. Milos-T2]